MHNCKDMALKRRTKKRGARKMAPVEAYGKDKKMIKR
jgi:hypothetical protein